MSADYPSMTTAEIRSKFLNFFEERGLKLYPSSSLVPDDPSLLLANAGMNQFKEYYQGKKTMKEIGADKPMLIYIISYFFYIDGVHTIISMSTSYGTNLGLDSAGMLLALLLVQVLGLQHRLGHLPSELSGGQQQRVSIGRALMNNPAILLADEPTGNLDSKNSKEIVELLRQFNKALNQTVIIITHDERIALDADRVIAVEDGKIVKDEVIRQ